MNRRTASTLAWLLALAMQDAAAVDGCGAGLPMRAVAGAAEAPVVAMGVVNERGGARDRLPLNRHFQLELQVCPAQPLPPPRVDADMPAHRHGMNYRTTVLALPEPGRYRAEGLLLHMPGRWRLIVELALPQGPLRLTHEIDVR
jgi:hypothetical protein